MKKKGINKVTDSDIASVDPLPGKPLVVERNDHSVSRKNIDQDAIKVLRRLNSYGYQAFLVGGGVRDLLLGKEPKDFDIGTSARPEQIKELFRNSRIIGKRFKLVHVYFKGGKIIEVSTFRAAADNDNAETLAHDNTFGDPQSDAIRRDLTINGLFYSVDDFSIIDYVGGISDLEKKIVRVIGDPDVRFLEDPVRIIRASRHAARIDFSIDPSTSRSMKRSVKLLNKVPPSRMYEEFLKDLFSGTLRKTFVRHYHYGIISRILPTLQLTLEKFSEKERELFYQRLDVLDELIAEGKDPLSELFLIVFLIGNVSVQGKKHTFDPENETDKLALLSQIEFSEQLNSEKSVDSSLPSFKLRPIRRLRPRERVSSLAKEIGEWFLPVTLTKREKIALERLLILRYRVLTASPDEINSVSELLHSLHKEELESVSFLCDLYKSDVPRGLKSILSGNKKKKSKIRTRNQNNKKRSK